MNQSDIQNEQTESQFTYVISQKPSFPANLFRFKEYDGLKLFAASLLLISFIYFAWTFIGLLVNSHHTYSTIGSPSVWGVPFQTLLKSAIQVFHSAIDIFNIVVIATPLILSYFFAWTIFDPRNVAMYILSGTNLILGFLEILSPFDFIPDFIPVAGSLDDSVLGGGLIGYGCFLLFQARKNKDRIETIIELMNEHSEEKALQLLLSQQGVSIQRTARS